MQPSTVVDVQGLHKWFGRHEVLAGVDLHVRKGQVVAIIGPSGAGKSTLLRCINYLVPFESGSVDILGERLVGTQHATPADRRGMASRLRLIRTRVGMVFQSFNLFPHLSVLDNVALGPRQVLGQSRHEAEERALALLQRVGLAEKRSAFPRQLSGGQQQRVAICRALAMGPEVMLFDEVTSMLDPELVGEVLDVMGELADEGMTMLVVTHEMAFARDVADMIVVMADGKIIESGDPNHVFTSPTEERTRVFLQRVLRQKHADFNEPLVAPDHGLEP